MNWGRASVGETGMILVALFFIIIGANVEAPYVAIGFLSFGADWLYFTVSPFWSSTTDLSKPYAGALSGLMNTGANLGGTLSPTLTPWPADSFGWAIALVFIGSLCCHPIGKRKRKLLRNCVLESPKFLNLKDCDEKT